MSSTFGQSSLYAKIAPQNILHPELALIPVSLEYQFKNFGLEYEHGFQLNSFFLDWNARKTSMSYFRSQVSLRYYLRNDEYTKWYLAFNFSYLPLRYISTNNWYTVNGTNLHYKSSEVIRYKFRYLLVSGFKIPLKNNISCEFNTGLGIRNRLVVHQPTGISIQDDFLIRNEWIKPFDREAGSSIIPSVYLSFRFQYQLF